MSLLHAANELLQAANGPTSSGEMRPWKVLTFQSKFILFYTSLSRLLHVSFGINEPSLHVEITKEVTTMSDKIETKEIQEGSKETGFKFDSSLVSTVIKGASSYQTKIDWNPGGTDSSKGIDTKSGSSSGEAPHPGKTDGSQPDGKGPDTPQARYLDSRPAVPKDSVPPPADNSEKPHGKIDPRPDLPGGCIPPSGDNDPRPPHPHDGGDGNPPSGDNDPRPPHPHDGGSVPDGDSMPPPSQDIDPRPKIPSGEVPSGEFPNTVGPHGEFPLAGKVWPVDEPTKTGAMEPNKGGQKPDSEGK